MRISNWPFGRKISIIVGASLIGMAATVWIGLQTMRGEMMEGRRLQTRALVETAHGVAAHFAAEAKAGRMSTEDAQKTALATLKDLRYSGKEYFWVNDMQPRMIMHPIKPELDGKDISTFADPEGKKLFVAMVETVQKDKAGFVDYMWPKPGFDKPVAKVSYVKGVDEWGWVIGSGIYLDDVAAMFWREATVQGGGVLVIMVLVVGASWWLGRNMTSAMAVISAAMTRLAAGDTSISLEQTDRKDEIGSMLRSVLVFRDNAVDVKAMHEDQEAQRQRGSQERSEARNRLATDLDESMSATAQAVSAAAGQLQNTASALAGSADHASKETAAVAAAAEQTSANVETVAAAAEELSTSISEISRRVGHSAEIARDAVEVAHQTDGVVRSLADAAARIGEVVQLINDIAGQTNLLALNATIEAARAGDAGKGFAVVANEVKGLANQTARATGDISNQITAIQATSGEAVRAIQEIGITIERMSGIAAEIAGSVEQQGLATREIARNVADAAAGAQEVSLHIAVISRAVGETGTAARDVRSAADRLADDSHSLQSDLGRFVSGIRGA
jgi:methyl-accepting chemotaxis protein